MGKRRRVRKNAPKLAGQRPDGKPAQPSGKRGRPYAIQDVEKALEHIEACGQIWATKEEIAAFLNVDYTTLLDFFAREPRAQQAFDRGFATGKLSLRRDQKRLSEKNATMAIFLGMNVLDQQDKRNLSGKVVHEHTVMDELLDEIDAATRERERKMIDVTPAPEKQDAA